MKPSNIVRKHLDQFPNLEFTGAIEDDGSMNVYGITDERTGKAYLTGFGAEEDFREFRSGYYLLNNEMTFITLGHGTVEAINTMEEVSAKERLDRLTERDMRNLIGQMFDDTVH